MFLFKFIKTILKSIYSDVCPPDCETKLSLSNKAIAFDLIYLRIFTKKLSWSLFSLLVPWIVFT